MTPTDHAQSEFLTFLLRLTQQREHTAEVVSSFLRLQIAPLDVLDDPGHAVVGKQIQSLLLRERNPFTGFGMIVGVVHKENAGRGSWNRRRAAIGSHRRQPGDAPATGDGKCSETQKRNGGYPQ